MTTRTHRIDGIKCPSCDQRELDVTFEPIYGFGLPDGCSDIVRRECPVCPWKQEGAGE